MSDDIFIKKAMHRAVLLAYRLNPGKLSSGVVQKITYSCCCI